MHAWRGLLDQLSQHRVGGLACLGQLRRDPRRGLGRAAGRGAGRPARPAWIPLDALGSLGSLGFFIVVIFILCA